VHAAHSGDAFLSPAVAARLIAPLAQNMRQSVEPPGYGQLTPREREVLLLVAQGSSNAEIAAELHVSEATVKSHLTGVLGKLGLRDRAQAIVLAYEHGLV
jgi:DNA-binding NarL/FixJ family response regulator